MITKTKLNYGEHGNITGFTVINMLAFSSKHQCIEWVQSHAARMTRILVYLDVEVTKTGAQQQQRL